MRNLQSGAGYADDLGLTKEGADCHMEISKTDKLLETVLF